MDVRIGVAQTPSLISLEMADDTDRDALLKEISGSLGDDDNVLTLTDKKGKTVLVPVEKITFVEIGAAESPRPIGFGG
jgi:hypothetical protein